MKQNDATLPTLSFGIRALLLVGPILLYLGATGFGITEVHSSTDTWIGLAAGRQILTADEFPKTDTFSYTFNGKVWYNQNWLTHLIQYWLYAYITPNAVVYGTWAIAACVFFFALLAAYWRSGNWFGAFVAAGMVGLGCRDFLSARPATTGFFCISALWALICAMEGQESGRRRWWPIALILPLLLFWGNAHGSFIFGYGVLGLYIGHWYVQRVIRLRHGWIFTLPLVLLVLFIAGVFYSLVPQGAETQPDEIVQLGAMTYYKGKLQLVVGGLIGYALYWLWTRVFRPTPTLTDRQAAGIVAAVVAALILTIALSPFHLKNFTHGEKIASSSLFRQVSEWNPPFARHKDGTFTLKPDFSRDSYPPMDRFWWIFGNTLAVVALLGAYALINRLTAEPRGRSPAPHRLSLFDLALLIIGVAMTFWARRFAPIFYIFGMPILLTWILNCFRTFPVPLRHYGRYAFAVLAGIGAAFVIFAAWSRIDDNLVHGFKNKSEFNLLERVTRYDSSPHDSILFLRENQLNVNLVTEWTQAGPVMFFAPNAKVFMDGRAQQVYDEDHYKKYAALLVAPMTPPTLRIALLNEFKTDAILLRRISTVAPLWRAVEQSKQWVPVMCGYFDTLSLRRDSQGLKQLEERLRNGEEWRPNTPYALAARGFLWEALELPDYEEALRCWQAALEQDLTTGLMTLQPLTERMIEMGRGAEAKKIIQGYYQALGRPVPRLAEVMRRQLQMKLTECWAILNEQPPPEHPQEDAAADQENQTIDHESGTNDR